MSINEAAKLWYVDHTTLYKKIRKGHLTLSVRPDGTRGIETSQMFREFGEPSIRTPNKLLFIAWLQIIEGLVFAISLMLTLCFTATVEVKWLFSIITIIIAFSLFSFLAGYNLIKRNTFGYILTLINQLLQVIQFNIAGYGFKYNTFGGVYLTLFSTNNENWSFSIQIYFEPGFMFRTQQEWTEMYITINLIVIVIMQMLLSNRKFMIKINHRLQ